MTKVSWQWGQEAQNGRNERSRPFPYSEVPQSSSAPSTRSRPERGLDAPASSTACGVTSGSALPAPTPPRRPQSGPPNEERSAIPLCQGHSQRPSNSAGAVGRVVPSPVRGHREAQRWSEKTASWVLPKPVSIGQLVADRGSSLGNLELIAEGPCGVKFKLFL